MSWPDPWHLLVTYLVASYVIVGGYWTFGFIVLWYRQKSPPLIVVWYLVPLIAVSPLYLLASVLLLPRVFRRRRGEEVKEANRT